MKEDEMEWSEFRLHSVNEIHEITPFNQIRLNWSVSLNWINARYTSWLQSFTASFLRVNEESELISSHFVHFFNSSLNFIQFHSMNWLKWEWMKPFTAPAVWTRFTRGRCAPSLIAASFTSSHVPWMNAGINWRKTNGNFGVPFTPFS